MRPQTSQVLKKHGLRIAVGSIGGSFAQVRLATDQFGCGGNPDVGQSLVATNSISGEDDYTKWCRVIIDRIEGEEVVVLVWSVGTGKAPFADEPCE